MPLFDAHAYYGESPFSSSMATPDAVRQTMRAYETDGVALISSLAAQCDFVAGNAALAPALDAAEGVYGWVTLGAGYPALSNEEQHRYLGKREWVGGVMFGHGGRPVTLEDANEVLNAHRRYTKPMALLASDADAVHAAARIAVAYPAMRFLLLTMGGEDWHAAVAASRQHLNIFLELSGSLDADKVSAASAALTPRKLIYGSGMPHHDPAQAQALVSSAAGLTGSDRARILSQNAMAFLNVQSDTD